MNLLDLLMSSLELKAMLFHLMSVACQPVALNTRYENMHEKGLTGY